SRHAAPFSSESTDNNVSIGEKCLSHFAHRRRATSPAGATPATAATARGPSPAAAAAAAGGVARAGRARGRRNRARQLAAEVVGERHGIVGDVAAALVPGIGGGTGRRGRQNAGEAFRPGVLQVERYGVRQKTLEQLRRFLRRMQKLEAFLLRDAEI